MDKPQQSLVNLAQDILELDAETFEIRDYADSTELQQWHINCSSCSSSSTTSCTSCCA